MLEQEIKQLLESKLASCTAEVEMAGNHLNLVVVSPAFEGLNPVKKQQLVYGLLSDYIASGTVHAVNMRTLTPEQAG
ncbi:BolA family iron metabolism protein IbaG [Halioxenophilus aromaticivorans]|uniref:BolA family iron metabolism protein IbaG n=2 Tax=Halioxenophilus aromaticivorans TaxID=1306992 RepID=A0AAV3U718_9ALTE